MAHEVAWLFPGQGAQEVGMGRALAEAHPLARQTFEEADDLLGESLSKVMFEGPKALLDDTINTQPALYVHSVALVRVAQAEGLLPDAGWAAGHSLGEYSAFTAMGALPFDSGLRLVRERGRLMKEAGTLMPGGMAAIISLDDTVVAQLCAEASAPGEAVQVANFNCPGQVVISGASEAVARASEAARAAGARKVQLLDVSIAAHSPLMEHAQQEFARLVAEIPLQNPAVPIIANVTVQPLRTPAEMREEMVAQLTGSVRWSDSMSYLVAQGVTTFIEIGSGAVLSGLMKRIERASIRHNVATWDELLALKNA
ncbi:MAG: ACP S-malonyltransferase [Ardenticatenales bacterium]|nr:ACP S-malonyltransferase [Ardenticatenales bacterium]